IALLLAATLFMQRPGALQPGTGIVTGTLKVQGGASAEGIRVGAVAIDDPTASSFLSVAETHAAREFRVERLVAGRVHGLPRDFRRSQCGSQGCSPARLREELPEVFSASAGVHVPDEYLCGEREPPRRDGL